MQSEPATRRLRDGPMPLAQLETRRCLHRPTAGCRPRLNGLQCCLPVKTPGRLEDSSMSLIRCSNCAHDNPADSKFCGACGGALHLPAYLASCPRCGTVNPVKATVCCWCQGPLAGRRPSRRPSPVVVGTAVLAAVAALGYYTYPQLSLVLARQPPAAGGPPVRRRAGSESSYRGDRSSSGDQCGEGRGAGAVSPGGVHGGRRGP